MIFLSLALAAALDPAAPPSTFDGAPAAIACPQGLPDDMACIPGGVALRGDDGRHKPARPAEWVWIQTFLMDKNEVTYADYKACEKAGDCPKDGPNYRDFNAPTQPINGIDWYAAKKYCETKGKRLPTEAEWEKAARGPKHTRYSWGDERATCKRAVIKDKRGRSCGKKQRSKKHADVGRPEPVGSKPAGGYGLYDMAGNSWEWVQDWGAPTYKKCGDACRGVDPKGPCDGADKCPGYKMRVVRGGSWYWPASYATAFHRRFHTPNNKPVHHFGFRCAQSVDVQAPK